MTYLPLRGVAERRNRPTIFSIIGGDVDVSLVMQHCRAYFREQLSSPSAAPVAGGCFLYRGGQPIGSLTAPLIITGATSVRSAKFAQKSNPALKMFELLVIVLDTEIVVSPRSRMLEIASFFIQ